MQWVPSGEAFRISDLSRLESETLPLYFRHSRFQSLVRQLNFYNFRKINRERTFWVYYHPLFHRDRPEEMHNLRRRTCPGYDGRRNRPIPALPSMPPPPPDNSINWSTEADNNMSQEKTTSAEGKEEGMAPSPRAGIKVSRSPSPSNSPMVHPPAGRGAVSSSSAFTGSSLKSFVSEEEKSPKAMRKASRHPSSLTSSSSDNGVMMEGQKDLHCADSSENVVMMTEYNWSKSTHADPLQAQGIGVDQLNHPSLNGSGYYQDVAPLTKKSRKAKLTIWSDNEDDSFSSTRKKYSKMELQERQDHLLIVAEVSRHLNGICSDYVASISAKTRSSSRGKGRGRSLVGANNNPGGQAIRSTSPVFGLDKPHDHYYGAGKCDLFTYDCEDGFVIDEQDDGKEEEIKNEKKKKKKTVVTPIKIIRKEEPEKAVAPPSPPSQCPIVNQSLVQACMEGKLVCSKSIFERTLAAAILSFCLSTHPQDPDIAKKISAHLSKGPMLAQEFEMYRKAMHPGVYANGGRMSASDDLERDWKMFSVNFIKRVPLAFNMHELLTAAENGAIKRCVASWFKI
ncbi:hypothetical protein ACHAXR_004028 [Thalassiosira sp. AJA248-18]